MSKYASLTPPQRAWIAAKAGWEHMSISAVLASYDVPSPEHLNADGTARRCDECLPDGAAWDHGMTAAQPVRRRAGR